MLNSSSVAKHRVTLTQECGMDNYVEQKAQPAEASEAGPKKKKQKTKAKKGPVLSFDDDDNVDDGETDA